MGRGPDRKPRRTGATCIRCGLVAGNTSAIPVYRYRLQRTLYRGGVSKSTAIASVGLCDRCIKEKGETVRDYSERNANIRHRHLPPGGTEWQYHQHGGYVAHHTHPSLGPAEEDTDHDEQRADRRSHHAERDVPASRAVH